MRVQIIPDTEINNKDTDTFINNIHYYKTPLQRIRTEKDMLILDNQLATSWEIEITSKKTEFYIHFDESQKNTVLSEINQMWRKATIKDANSKLIFKNPIISTLNLQYHHFLSLRIDKRGLTPLPAILETSKLIKDTDKAFIQVIFEPESHDWYKNIEAAIKDFQKGYIQKKIEISRKNITRLLIKAGIKTLQETLSVVSFFLTDEEMKFDDIDTAEYENLLRRGLSQNTHSKSAWHGYNVQFRIVVDSYDLVRRESIMRGIVNAFKGLSEDNCLNDKKINEPLKYLPLIQGRKIKWTLNKNILSAAELGQMIQMPTKTYQEIYGIDCIDTREIQIPNELISGDIPIGTVKHKGIMQMAHWNNNKNILALPKIVIGPMGSGKSEYTKKFCVEAGKRGDGVILFDYIKSCGLSNDVAKYFKPDKCIKINLSEKDCLYALAYPELQPDESDNWQRLKTANTLSRQVEYLINSICDADTGPLTAPMLRYFNAACMVVFIHPGKTIDDVFKCLKRWNVRNEYIRLAKYSECFDKDDDIFSDLEDLHDRDNDGKIIGTKEYLIIGITNRISAFNRDIYIKKMLSSEINYEQNFSNWMDEGKIILIQIPEDTFTNKAIKDLLVTYYMSRVWLAALKRKNHDKVCHIVTDEIYQVPTAAALCSGVITEARKFGIGFFFTIHYLKQFRLLHDSIRSAGCSYMILAGTEKENLKSLEEELKPFSVSEGLCMKPWHSLNIINYGNQYSKFISKLPKPV